MKTYICIFLSWYLLLSVGCTTSESVLVKNNEELKKAISSAKPGAKIVLANGVWNDIEMDFHAVGEKDKLISLEAQEKEKCL
ncbi:MAG: hypothetical protein IPL55_06640 [Saprospiraceae bacterium]|nr:hypothetical protein [Saprospiraceae bacterium]